MTTSKPVYLSFLFLACALAGAAGESVRTDINPALTYYQAWLLAPSLPGADLNYLYDHERDGQTRPEHFGELVAQYEPELKLLRRAAQAHVPCDWGIDFASGPGTALPHLSRVKMAAIAAARFRAVWDLQNGRQAEARDNLIAAFVLGRNCARDGTLISALVQIAVENIVCSVVAENFYLFAPETLHQLIDGFEAAPARTTMAAGMSTERACFSDWILSQVLELQKENPGNDAKVMARIRELLAGLEGPGEDQSNQTPPNHWEQITKAAGGTSDGVIRLIRDGQLLYQRAAAILALPPSEYEEPAKQFSAEIEQSSNPLVVLAFPAIAKARPKEFGILAELAMVQAAVEYKLHGEAGFRSVADPCGKGPFAYERFVLDGKDRGIELKSAYSGRGFQEVLIFVEQDGPPFRVNGKDAGQALPKSSAAK